MRIFKFIFGLGNDDVREVRRLTDIYATAKADMFDSSVQMLPVIQEAIAESDLNLEDFQFCVSISIGQDIHGAKALIDKALCTKCEMCTSICPRGGVEKCIGCMKCKNVCKSGALSFIYEKTPWEGLEKAIGVHKIDSIEMHSSIENKELIEQEFKKLCDIFKGEVSICISQKYFKDEALVTLLSRLRDTAKDNKGFIVQTDGSAMSGLDNELETTRACVELGKYLADKGFKVILSGGVNARTPELVKKMDLKCYGLAYGSYARKIVKDMEREQAIKVAEKLICKAK